MKTILIFTAFFILSAGCKSKTERRNLAGDICDCFKKANAVTADDEKRTRAQDACATMEKEARKNLKSDVQKYAELDSILNGCANQMLIDHLQMLNNKIK